MKDKPRSTKIELRIFDMGPEAVARRKDDLARWQEIERAQRSEQADIPPAERQTPVGRIWRGTFQK